MTLPDQLFASEALTAKEPAAPLSGRIRSFGLQLLARVDTCADRWAAAAIYTQLSALSDAELARRGLSRATLAHDVRATGDRIAE